MALPPKLCPECREEYVHTVSVCVHCEVPLVLEEQAEAPTGDELPPASELQLVRAAAVGWAMELSERLGGHGIPHRVESLADGAPGRRGRELPYGVFVQAEHAERAGEIDAGLLREQLPDLPDEHGGDASAEGCPACGASLAADARECGDCGLAIPGVE